MARPKHLLWLLQAESNLRSVEVLIDGAQYADACFNAQQCAEKALKALAYFRGSDLVKSHSLKTISEDLGINGELQNFAFKLDLYYLSSRYPDALPDDAVPAERFTKAIADEAREMAIAFIKKVKKQLENK